MKTSTETIKLKQIKIDPELQRLRPINAVFVNRYRQAMRAGCVFPKIIAYRTAKNTYTIASGNHRFTAMLQEYGEEYEIEITVLEESTKIERLEIFAKENADHGNPLDGIQRRSIANALLRAGANEERVASIFGITVGRLEKWEEYKVLVYDKHTKETEDLPVKRGMEPPNNTMTLDQWKKHRAADKAGSFAQKAHELIRWMDGKLIQATDENLIVLEELIESADKFHKWMKVGKAS
jgi:hypothetical protein